MRRGNTGGPTWKSRRGLQSFRVQDVSEHAGEAPGSSGTAAPMPETLPAVTRVPVPLPVQHYWPQGGACEPPGSAAVAQCRDDTLGLGTGVRNGAAWGAESSPSGVSAVPTRQYEN